MSLYSAPSLSGVMIESSTYQLMGQGRTDRVFIIGHGDGLTLNDPYQVLDPKAACIALNLDSTSPLVRTLLEVYYGGGKDIWLVAAAPMSEYEPDPALRDALYYQTYANRLTATYELLEEWDLAQILVVAEAPFYNAHGVDFATPLVEHCQSSFLLTGAIRLGLLGTRTGTPLTQADVDAMSTDPRLLNMGDAGKFLGIMVGEGSYSFSEMPTAYTGSVIGAVAANMSRLDLRLSIVYSTLSNITTAIGQLTKSQISQLAEAKLNPLSLTTKGARGAPYQVVMLTDNTLGPNGTDFWTLGQTRLILAVLGQITIMGKRTIGTIAYGQFKADVDDFLVSIKKTGYIQSYKLSITRDPNDTNGILVNIVLTPYVYLRQISFTATIGPGA